MFVFLACLGSTKLGLLFLCVVHNEKFCKKNYWSQNYPEMSNLHMRTEYLQRALAHFFFFPENLLIEKEATNQEISLIASYKAAQLECLPKILSVWVSVFISNASTHEDRLVAPHEK